jgi:hypothetical protein
VGGGGVANKGGFSWKRATGVTRQKQRISRRTGIPLTKSGRQRKIGRMVTGGGCLIPTLVLALAMAGSLSLASVAFGFLVDEIGTEEELVPARARAIR